MRTLNPLDVFLEDYDLMYGSTVGYNGMYPMNLSL